MKLRARLSRDVIVEYDEDELNLTESQKTEVKRIFMQALKAARETID